MGNPDTEKKAEAAANVVRLSKAISAHGAETHILEFREPNGDDIMECGMPFDIIMEGKKQRIVINTASVGEYISRLAAIPPSSVKLMKAPDFNECFNKVMGFFGDMKA